MLDHIYTNDNTIEELEIYREKISQIKQKIEKGEALSWTEKEQYGNALYSEYKNTDVLNEDFLKEFKFKHLLLEYLDDLTFQGTYYKFNPERPLTELESKTLLSNRSSKPDFDEYLRGQLIKKGVYIEIPADEVAKDKAYLLKDAKEWAKIVLKTNHKDANLGKISKETRDTIKELRPKPSLDKYVEGDFDNSEQFYDITTAIFKSKYVHFEALKFLEEMSLEGRKAVFPFLNGEVHYTYSSIIHIMNRHFAQLLSSSNISLGKSFHNTNINPYKMDIRIGEIFSEIEKSGLRRNESLARNTKVYFQYQSSDYAIFIDLMKHDKSKFEIRTFTEIDTHLKDGKRIYKDMRTNHNLMFVNDNLGIYYPKNKT